MQKSRPLVEIFQRRVLFRSLQVICIFVFLSLKYTKFDIFDCEYMKYLHWIGSSQKDLKTFSQEVREGVLYALFQAQNGNFPRQAKVLQGFGGAGVIEIKESDRSGIYRVVYTVKMENVVFVLHAFQKKSKSGIATPKQEVELIKTRLIRATEIYKSEYKNGIKT